MARSEMFESVTKKYINADLDDIISAGESALSETIGGLQSCGVGSQNITNFLLRSVRIGANGTFEDAQKELFDILFSSLTNDTTPYYSNFNTPFSENELLWVAGIVGRQPDILSVPVLNLILSFAYANGKIDDDLAEKLDNAFSPYLLEEFIAQWYEDEDPFATFDDVCEHFSDAKKSDVQRVLDNLCDRGVLFKSDTVAGTQYLRTS